MSDTPSTGERGAALLSVLLIVSAMTVAALIALDAVTRSISLAKTAQARSQAAWHAQSAEAIAVSAVEQLDALTQMNLTPHTPRLGETTVIDVGPARIEARLTDASNCFNLNTLAAGDEQAVSNALQNVAAYGVLLEGLGVFDSDASALVDALADWMDPDTVPRSRGAEDGYYVSLTPPYRTSGTALENVTELRAVLGYERAVREAIAPVACVRPDTEQSVLNLNMLTDEQAPLLTALYSEALDPDSARRLLFRRPQGGWPDIESFRAEPLIQQIAADKRRDQLVGLRSQYVRVDGFVAYDGGQLPFEMILSAKLNEPVRVVSRRHGDD